MASVLFEACVDSVASARAAISGGARRLELCESLVEGGVTPSAGKVAAVVRVADEVPVHVLIRPRAGDFFYDDDEIGVMLVDIAQCKALGVAGIVSGVLLPDGSVDVVSTRRLVDASRPMRFTFHRAIDASADVASAFRECLALGVDYVLTSGGAATALEGAAVIGACVEASKLHNSNTTAGTPSTVVIAGGGIASAEIASAVVRATGVSQLHGTARRAVRGASVFRRDPPVYMGGEKVRRGRRDCSELRWPHCTGSQINSPDAEYGLRVADATTIAAIVEGMRGAVVAAAAAAEQGDGAAGSNRV